jgi:hypothetical protein
MAKSYISMKSLSESLVALDLPPTNAMLNLKFFLYVTHPENSSGLGGFVQSRISVPGFFHQWDFFQGHPLCSASAKGNLSRSCQSR